MFEEILIEFKWLHQVIVCNTIYAEMNIVNVDIYWFISFSFAIPERGKKEKDEPD